MSPSLPAGTPATPTPAHSVAPEWTASAAPLPEIPPETPAVPTTPEPSSTPSRPPSGAAVVLRAEALSKGFKSPCAIEKPAAAAPAAALHRPLAPVPSAPVSGPVSPAASGRLEILRDISLEICESEFVSIQGASGAGKTTLLQILGGLDQPDSGRLFWNGKLVSGRGNAFLARHRALWLGYVFQSYHLIPELNALENVVLAGRIAGCPAGVVESRARELLEHVGLASRLWHLPSKLSGGECQRVAIARALVNQPRVLLADEPTGNLDEATGEKIMDLLLSLTIAGRVALVLVTHNPAFAARAPRRYHLSCGTLREVPAAERNNGILLENGDGRGNR
ncbi:MAG: ABC transporter ATP-binding protein [Puniceicoccales bacterium]|jgi:predicted ABC-type transport system involved in lysophospholipase L1 biosynthesis ATPase subunit|nr:ABC transporter ATP-binding protein [Puniceicoccales bacterium]